MICIMHPRNHLTWPVSVHHVHQHGKPQAHLLGGIIHSQLACRQGVRFLQSLLGRFGDTVDWDDGVCTSGHLAALCLPFSFPTGALAVNPGNSLSSPPYDVVSSVLTISTLTSFKCHAGDASGPSPDSGSLSGKLLWSLSFKMVWKGPMSPVEKQDMKIMLVQCSIFSVRT